MIQIENTVCMFRYREVKRGDCCMHCVTVGRIGQIFDSSGILYYVCIMSEMYMLKPTWQQRHIALCHILRLG